jgi:hypothetical protein
MKLKQQKYIYILLIIIMSFNVTLGQKGGKNSYQQLFKKGVIAYQKGKWQSARRHFLESLNNCSFKDSIDIIKANIVNSNVAESTERSADNDFLIGRDKIGANNIEKLLGFSPNNKKATKKLEAYWKRKIKQAVRKKSYETANLYVEHLALFDSAFTKKKQRVILQSIQKSKEKYSKKMLKVFELNQIDSISIEKRLADTLSKFKIKYTTKEASDTLKIKNGWLHFGVVGGVNYSLPQFTIENQPFDRVYPQTANFTGWKLTVGQVTSHFSFSAEYRTSKYQFNTYTNNNPQNKKINLEDFSIETTDIPLYINYQLRSSLYGRNLLIFSMGGTIHKSKLFYYRNYPETKELNELANLNSSWYSMLIGASFQKKIYKNLKAEFFVKYNYGLNGFLNLESLNALFKPALINNIPNNKPITSSKMNSLNVGIALQLF